MDILDVFGNWGWTVPASVRRMCDGLTERAQNETNGKENDRKRRLKRQRKGRE